MISQETYQIMKQNLQAKENRIERMESIIAVMAQLNGWLEKKAEADSKVLELKQRLKELKF